jgi:BlaI family transcriptional regulator, penicillinase repressor
VPPKQSATLTEAELRIMDVLWRKGSGTVQQVLDWLPSSLAYNSVLTTIRILEKKGHLKHAKDGRAHVYEPVIGREEATRSEIRHLVSRFFRNSHEALVLNILQDEQIDADQLKRMRTILEESDINDQHLQAVERNAKRSEGRGEERSAQPGEKI